MAATKAPAASGKHLGWARSAQRRYVDAYRVANTVDGFGQLVKIGGILLGLLVWAGVTQAVGSGIGGFAFGLIVGALFFVVGVIVAAHGQLLKATIDTAVHSSPFLTNDTRAAVMSLPTGRTDDSERDLAIPFGSPNAAAGSEQTDLNELAGGLDEASSDSFCYHCGAEIRGGATKCDSCGKAL